jgi:hypothetical protein
MDAPQRPEHELKIDEYTAALKKYKQMEEAFLSGEVAVEINRFAGGDPVRIKEQFQAYVQQLQAALEDSNAKLRAAKDAFRQVVQMQQRGPEGKATKIDYGPLSVSSVTNRWLDPTSLLSLAAKYQILDRLLALTSFDKDGKEFKLVEQRWVVNYEHVVKWLQENKFENIINGSYDEKEATPQVKGAKPLAFLGEKIEKT